jgi:hypothetical protein
METEIIEENKTKLSINGKLWAIKKINPETGFVQLEANTVTLWIPEEWVEYFHKCNDLRRQLTNARKYKERTIRDNDKLVLEIDLVKDRYDQFAQIVRDQMDEKEAETAELKAEISELKESVVYYQELNEEQRVTTVKALQGLRKMQTGWKMAAFAFMVFSAGLFALLIW